MERALAPPGTRELWAVLEFALVVSRLAVAHTSSSDNDAVVASYQRLTSLVLKGTGPFAGFINYRVASEKDMAETLCYQLLASGIKVFWDRQNLPDGAPWETCFRIGLRNSNHMIALISADGLDGMAERVEKGLVDNVLLEYEMAVDQEEMQPGFLVVLMIGESKEEGGELKLWSKRKEAWQTITANTFPEGAHSVTAPNRTVRQTISKLLAAPRIPFSATHPGRALTGLAKALKQSEFESVPQPVGTSFTGTSFTGAFLISVPAHREIATVVGLRLLTLTRQHNQALSFGWDTAEVDPHGPPRTASKECLRSVRTSSRNILFLSRPELVALQAKLLQQIKQEVELVDPTLHLIEEAVDRLATDPTSLLLVTVAEYLPVAELN
eukprot:g59708.t1